MKPATDDIASSGPIFRDKVERIVEERIRPSLRLHGGDMYVKDADDGIVRVVFTGACEGCPSAQITMEETVREILREELGGELKEVRLVNETDEDLLNFARQLLNKNK